MRKIGLALALSAVAAAAVNTHATAVRAQTAKASAGVEEVVVTAQRRSEVLSKVPMSITAFTSERIDQLNAKNFGDLVASGSEGGTVRFITPKPSLEDLQIYGKTELSFTQDGAPSYEGGLAVGAPIVDDKLGFRVSGWWRHDGGWIDHLDPYTGKTIE